MKYCRVDSLPIKNLDWERLVPLIAEAHEAIGRLDERLKKLTSKQFQVLKKKECRASLRGKNRKKAQFALEGLNFSIEWAKKQPLNLAFLCKLHAIVKQDGKNPKEVGRLREKQNWIGPEGRPMEEAYFYPPDPQKVKPYMRQLFHYLRGKEKDPLVQLAIFFAQLLIIHPFMDGNGRVARIFVPVWLWKKGLISKPALFLSNYFQKTRLEYFRKLFNISADRAWEEWIEYFLKGLRD